jgi:2-oxoglutarate dehydrogenase E1 component
LAGNDNMQIVNATTPAQYFHLLRRQVLRSLRKPLIVFTHKTLLRHASCVSSLDDLMHGSFQEILDDSSVSKDNVTRILLSTGKVYYDLLQEKTKSGESKIALVRIEELYPFHEEKLKKIIESYTKAQEIYWVQEEPVNMGAWSYIHPLLLELFGAKLRLRVSARKKSAAPAVGSGSIHLKEQEELIKKAFNFHE